MERKRDEMKQERGNGKVTQKPIPARYGDSFSRVGLRASLKTNAVCDHLDRRMGYVALAFDFS